MCHMELDGIGKYWVMSRIDYDTENPGTTYYWRDLIKVVKELLHNSSYRDDLIYYSCK